MFLGSYDFQNKKFPDMFLNLSFAHISFSCSKLFLNNPKCFLTCPQMLPMFFQQIPNISQTISISPKYPTTPDITNIVIPNMSHIVYSKMSNIVEKCQTIRFWCLLINKWSCWEILVDYVFLTFRPWTQDVSVLDFKTGFYEKKN